MTRVSEGNFNGIKIIFRHATNTQKPFPLNVLFEGIYIYIYIKIQ